MVVPPTGGGRDAATEVFDFAGAGAEGGLQPTMTAASRTACGGAGPATSARCALDAEPDLRDGPGAGAELPGAGSAPARAPAAVLIRHRGGSTAGREAGRRIADHARRAGVTVAGIRAVAAVPSRREVHYLRAEHAADGKRLASRLRDRWGSAWQVREPRSPKASPKLQPPDRHRRTRWRCGCPTR
jgi:hypothetical protein